MPMLIRKEARCSHHEAISARKRNALCAWLPSSGEVGIGCEMLFTENKIQPYAADFAQITIVQTHRALNRRTINRRHLVSGTQIITVITLVDLRRHFWFEPSLQPHRTHW